MKLYVCYGTFTKTPRPGGHPCGNAHRALRAAGHEPEVIRSYGLGPLPDFLNRSSGRREVKRLTGESWVPVLVLDDGAVVAGSQEIMAWAQAHPETAAAAGAGSDAGSWPPSPTTKTAVCRGGDTPRAMRVMEGARVALQAATSPHHPTKETGASARRRSLACSVP